MPCATRCAADTDWTWILPLSSREINHLVWSSVCLFISSRRGGQINRRLRNKATGTYGSYIQKIWYDPHLNPLNYHLTWHLPLQKLLTPLRACANWVSAFVPYSFWLIHYLLNVCWLLGYRNSWYWRCHNVLVRLAELSRGIAFSEYRKFHYDLVHLLDS